MTRGKKGQERVPREKKKKILAVGGGVFELQTKASFGGKEGAGQGTTGQGGAKARKKHDPSKRNRT